MLTLAKILRFSALCGALTRFGCGEPEPSPIGYYVDSPQSLAKINRLVLVELAPDNGGPQIARSMTEALFSALSRRKLFQVDVIYRNDPACRDLPLAKRERFTMDELKAMQANLKCDAILFGSVSHFQTYPRLQLGLRLRLLDLQAGKLPWGIDYVWDTTDKAPQARMKTFFERQMRQGYEPADWRLARMSPRTFQKFIAYEAVNTLPTHEQITSLALGEQ